MGKDLVLTHREQGQYQSAYERVVQWCEEHKWQVGLAEIALGAGLVAAGVQTGVIEMGAELVASVLDDGSTAGLLGGTGGAMAGVLPGLILKNIGVTALGGAIGVPAIALMGGGALLLGLAGYGAGRLVADFLQPSLGWAQGLGAGVMAVGVALMVDGARRMASDEGLRGLVTQFKDGVLHLGQVTVQRALTTTAELTNYLTEDIGAFLGDVVRDPKTGVMAAGMVAGGAAGGSVLAASTVTVLGSKALGGAALSLGLISAPVWPVIAGGGLAVAAAYGAWKLMRRNETPPAEHRVLLPPNSPSVD